MNPRVRRFEDGGEVYYDDTPSEDYGPSTGDYGPPMPEDIPSDTYVPFEADFPGALSTLDSDGGGEEFSTDGLVFGPPNPDDSGEVGPPTPSDTQPAGTYGNFGPPTPGEEEGVFTKLAKGLGLMGKDGKFDISDPKTINQLLKIVSTGGAMLNTLRGPQNKKSPAELQAQLKGPFDSFNPVQQAAANSYFSAPVAASRNLQYHRNGASLTPSKGYAEGGGVDSPQFVSQGALSSTYVRGDTGGQDDTVNALLSHGEHVFDADTVASIGDGNNEAGHKVLDGWKQSLRTHKRSAPASSIPPKFKGVKAYLPKGEK